MREIKKWHGQVSKCSVPFDGKCRVIEILRTLRDGLTVYGFDTIFFILNPLGISLLQDLPTRHL